MNCKSAPQFLTVSDEEAYEYVAPLADKQQAKLQGVTVYTGNHPTLGSIHVIIPAVGSSLVLSTF